MKVLVTGGSGFLGKYVIKNLLGKGYQVRSMARNPQTEWLLGGVDVYHGDVRNYESVLRATKGIDAVIHTVSKTGIWGTCNDYYTVNVDGTANIIKACNAHSIKYLVYTSTPSVVWNGDSLRGGDESLPYAEKYLCAYARTKAQAEMMVLNADEVGCLSTVALRPHLIWGNDDPHLLPKIIERASQGKLIQVGEGNNCVDMTHVENAAYAHILALEGIMEGQAAGKVYFISDGKPVNLWLWIDEVLKRLNLPKIKRKISLKNAYFLGFFMEGLYKGLFLKNEPRMTRFLATQLGKSHYFNIQKAENELGYRPIKDVENGFAEMIAQFSRQVKAWQSAAPTASASSEGKV